MAGTQWTLELDAPDGSTATPTILEPPEPEYVPSVNSRPRVEIAVPFDERYSTSDWLNAPMRVWIDGTPLPIARLEDHRLVERANRKVSVLEGRGGVELTEHVDESWDAAPIHQAAEDLITSATSYTANVDAPPTTTESGVEVQNAGTTAELRSRLLDPIDDTTPVRVRDGGVDLLKSGFVKEAEGEKAADDGQFSDTSADSQWSEGLAVGLQSPGDFAEVNFSLDYRIPKGAPLIAVRQGPRGGETLTNPPKVVYQIDGFTVAGPTYPDRTDAGWDKYTTPLSLDPGDHTLGVLVLQGNTDTLYVDLLAVLDDRFPYTFDNDPNSDGALDGPELYPDSVTVEFDDATVFRATTGATISSTWNDTSTNQRIGLSNDRGDTVDDATNTDTHTVDFPSRGATVRWEADLSRYTEDTSTTPATGNAGQSIQGFSLSADLEDVPLVVGERFDGQLVDVLARLADRGGYVWAFEDDGSTKSVEWTTPGQRSSTRDPALTGSEVEVDVGSKIEAATVKGTAQVRRGVRVTATEDAGAGLPHLNLVEESESVYDPTAGKRDTYEEYDRGTDYTIDYEDGLLTALKDGRIDDGQVLSVDYRFRPRARYVADGVSNPIEDTIRIPGVATRRAARQAARRVVEDARDPRVEADVSIPGTDPEFSVVDAVDPNALPTDRGPYLVRRLETRAGDTTLRLADRETTEELIQRVTARVRDVEDNA